MTISRIASTLPSAQDLMVNDDTFTTNDDSPLILVPSSILANDTGSGLIITGLSNPVNGSITFDPQGQIVFTPINTFSGSTAQASFQYTVTDENGITSTATVFVNVNSTNKAPIVSDDTAVTDLEQALTISIASLLTNDSDPDGNPISLLSVSDGDNGQVALDGNGNIIFTPNAGYTGPADFQYTIEDSRGASSTARVNLTVNAVNSAPIALNDTAVTDRDKALTIAIASLLANDSDPNGDPISLLSITAGNNGKAALDGKGNIIFTPTLNYAGNANFQYTIADAKGATSTATVAVTVNAVNRAPIAVNNTVTTDQNKVLTIPIATLLANDSDPDKNPISLVSVSNNSNGTSVLDGNGNIIFTPASEYAGNASFQYTIRDSQGATSNATVTVNVKALRLTAINDASQAITNIPATIFNSSLLWNDRDPANSRLSLAGVSNPLNGRVAINSFGNVVFTPNTNYVGLGGFTYTLQNAVGETTTGQVTVNVIRPPKMALGTNLASLADWSTQIPFIDAFKFSRSWIWEGPYTAINTNIDAKGWLTSVTPPANVPSSSLATTILLNHNQLPSGQYVVLYEGQGTIKYKFAATKNAALSSPGRDVINLDSNLNGGIFLQITSTDPNKTGDYIRNIRLLPAQHESTHTNLYNGQTFDPSTAKIFNPVFSSRIAPFQSVRFMDWMRTNGSNQVNWSDRPTLTDARWSTNKGTPVEVMVALANQGNFNPWFTMPHMANDDYVRNFAQSVKNDLAPNKKIYVEYTNEAWNWLFTQTGWSNTQAQAAGINHIQWYAQRSAQMINIWKDVFGTRSHQIVGVLGAQAANIGVANTAINYLKSTGNLSAINALAIAPYFGDYLGSPKFASQVQTLSVNDIYDELTQGGVIKNSAGGAAVVGGALEQSYGWMHSHANLAKQNNLQLLAYEGGQHLVGHGGVENNNTITNLFIAANRDPRMGQLYQQYLTRWSQVGGGLFMNYSDVGVPSKWGSWGAMEHLDDTGNSKYSALMAMTLPK